MSVKNILSALGISWDTVRPRLAAIYEKRHVHSHAEAVLKYFGHSAAPQVPPSAPPPRRR